MIQACIVGYGAIGPIHAAAITKTGLGKVYAVCDACAERIADCHEKYGAKVYYDFDTMLLDEAIDVVHICTPHYLHFEMIKKALAAGKQVVCEKPLTMTAAEFEQLLLLPNHDRICVVMQNRLNPCVQKMKEIIEKGTLGAVCSMKALVTWCRTAEYYAQDAWRGKWATEGGGVLINQAIHALDMMTYLAGAVSTVRAQMANFSLPEIEVEDTVMAYLSFVSGATGVFFATNSYCESPSPMVEVICSQGKIRYNDGKLFVNDELVEEDSKPSIGKQYWGNGHEMLMADYYDRNKFFTPLAVKNTMDAMFAIYESAESAKEVTV